MITLPEPLNKVMRSGNLEGIKPFAVLIRNKWHEESGGDSYFALDTDNPIDITPMIVKPNTLSMTLDVNEVAQYKANNVTLTIYDPFNRFIEGTPQSYFPQGYQLYGSQVILYYGLDDINRTPLFVGIIRDFPTHKPEQYQVDLKLISPLELLNDIEAKDFSDKYEGETLTLHGQDDDNNPIYQTAHTGVGGFSAIYADGNKMFEGVDYQLSQLSELSSPALVTIIKADLHSATITADYYCWKTGLSVEQIVSGLVALAGYTENTDIRSVVWNSEITTRYDCSVLGALCFTNNNGVNETFFNLDYNSTWVCIGTILNNFKLKYETFNTFILGDTSINNANGTPLNGIVFKIGGYIIYALTISYYFNGNVVKTYSVPSGNLKNVSIERNGNNFTITVTFNDDTTTVYTDNYNLDLKYLFMYEAGARGQAQLIIRDNANNDIYVTDNFGIIPLSATAPLTYVFLLTNILQLNSTLAQLKAEVEGSSAYQVSFRFGSSYNVWENWQNIDLDTDIGQESSYFQFLFELPSPWLNQLSVKNIYAEFLSSSLTLQTVNLSSSSVLEALQDFALISGYEFGVDRQGVFFFRPRSQSTTPVYDLDHDEIVKIDNVQKRFNDFFTKLTLQFGQRPLEFYANEGERPTPVDKYGIINKEIDKPDIVNYDNPELAQAIGPQLLAIYSNLADIIQLTGKLNLSLELGDVVNVKRNYNLTVPNNASDVTKFNAQDTYFRACKITGLNYNFSKRQITYTLHNVSNENNQPQYQFDEFIYDFQVPFGVKE